MNASESQTPRRRMHIAAIALITAPAFAMWFLGRGWLGLGYLVAGVVWAFMAFALAGYGYLPIPSFPGIDDGTWLQLFMWFPIAIVGILHAFAVRTQSLARPWFSRWSGLLCILVAMLVIAFLIRAFLIQPFNAPSGSMNPGLKQGDHFFVDKRAYGYGPYTVPFGLGAGVWDAGTVRSTRTRPERGDVAVFRLPTAPRVDYVKRVIGLPGDRVQMRDGRLFLNGESVKTEPAGEEVLPADHTSREQRVPRFRETLPSGRSYFVLDQRATSFSDQTAEFFVPKDHFFVLGDNRDNSTDSRFQRDVGFIPMENLIGRAVLIYGSRHPERLLTRVK